MKTVVMNYDTNETYREALSRTVRELGQAKRQEILDLLLVGGLNVGEIVTKLQLETVIVGQVICDNVETKTYSTLSSTAK